MRGEAECSDDLTGDGPHGDGDRMQALGKLLVVDGEAFLLYLLELYTQRVLAGDRVRAALCQLDRGERLPLPSVGEVREESESRASCSLCSRSGRFASSTLPIAVQ